MEFREATRLILARVEKETGIPVHVTEDPALNTLAALRMAREKMPCHVVSYKPSAETPPDYHICFECGFLLRLYACPPEARKSFVGVPQGRRELESLLKGPTGIVAKLGLPTSVLAQLRDQFFDGLMLQLRSVPVGMRVDDWLRRDYPELAELQDVSTRAQLQTNSQVLNPEVRQLTPEKVYRANVSMNGAFAGFWSDLTKDSRYEAPYKATKYWTLATKLLDAIRQIPDNPQDDTRLVDAWAKVCELTGWYEWAPYDIGSPRGTPA